MEIQNIYPLTPMQEGMLFHTLLNRESNAYFEQMSFDLQGNLDVALLNQSFNLLIQRYDIFRTIFNYRKAKKPLQVVLKERSAAVAFFEIVHLTEDEKKAFLAGYKNEDRARGFDLTKDILMRITVFQTKENSYTVLWSHHHILMDGWCTSIVIKEIFQIYHSLQSGQPVNLAQASQFSTYIKWLEKQDKSEAEDYWHQYLQTYSATAVIPTRKKVTNPDGYAQAEVIFELNEALTRELTAIAVKNHATLSTVFQTIWGILLQRYNTTTDVVFGTVVSGRPAEIPGIEKMVGLFINTVPLRIKAAGNQSFADLVKETQRTVLQSEKYHYYPLYKIQASSVLKQDLLEHILVFENLPVEKEVSRGNKIAGDGLTISNVETFEETNYHFNIIVGVGPKLTVKLSYNSFVHTPDFIESIAGHFQEVVRQVTEYQAILLAKINILTTTEKLQILHEFNNTAANYPQNKTIHALFQEQVKRTPDRIAAVCTDSRLTYCQFNEMANQLARALREKGVKAKTIVGIMVERSIEMCIGIMAILKAGGVYLPVSPDYPVERMEFLLKDSGAALLLTEENLSSKVQSSQDILFITEASYVKQASLDLEEVAAPTDLAYIIYTSGSTGKPKGVMVKHLNVVRLLVNDKPLFDFTADDVWTMFHSFNFDFSVWEMYGALLFGGKLIIVPKLTAQNPSEFLQLLRAEQVTVLNQTPTAFDNLSREELKSTEKALSLRYIIFGGEALKPAMVKAWHDKYPETKFINMYGITETTVHVTFKEIGEAEMAANLSNIGRPIPTLTTYIMDQNQNLLPTGVPGELCVGGDGLAAGYLNRPELMAEKFIPHPFQPGEKLYRSGDLARWLPNGELEYLGRIDNQVKIRGFRIEPGEIEAKLIEHPDVRAAVVVVKDGPVLSAYLVAEKQLTLANLRTFLTNTLPDYMIPTQFIQIDALPMTSNGKVNRTALSQIEGQIASGTTYVLPTNPTEEKLLKIWQEIFGFAHIGTEDNFFNLGGHSLLVISLVGKIYEQFGVELPLKVIFTASTIKSLAQFLEITENTLEEPLIQLTTGSGPNIFCFPPGTGYGLSYKRLADYLDSYTVYSFNFIEDADRLKQYVKLIQVAQNQGPYILLGYSAGGSLAFEVAQELYKAGQTVAHLILLDVDKNVQTGVFSLEEIQQAASDFIASLGKQVFNQQYIKEKIRRKIENYALYLNSLLITGTIPATISQIKANSKEEGEDLREGWKTATTGRFISYDGFGLHGEMLHPEYAGKNAEIIKAILQDGKNERNMIE